MHQKMNKFNKLHDELIIKLNDLDILLQNKGINHNYIHTNIDMNDDLVGDALECKSCHNYILYVIPDIVPGTNDLFLQPWKDEIYLLKDSKEILVMRNFEDNNTYVAIDNKRVTDFNGVLQFNSVEYLFKKLESIIVFS